MHSEFHKKVRFNLIWQICGKAISVALAFLTLAVMARYLSEEGMGQYATIIKFIGIFGLVADFGLNVITTRELSHPSHNKEEILANAFSLRLFLSLLVLFSAPLIAFLFPYTAEIKLGILISIVPFLFVLMTGIINSVLQQNLRTDKIMIADIVVKLITLIVSFFAIFWDYGLYFFIIALACGNIFGFLLTYYYGCFYIKLKWSVDLQIWKKLIKQAYPVAIINFFMLIYFNIDTLFLSVLKGSYDTGIYHLAYRVLETISNFAYSFSMIFIPFFAEHSATGRFDHIFHLFLQSIKYILWIAIPILIIGVITAPLVIKILAGDGFQESVIVLQILYGAVFFVFLNSLIYNTLSSIELQSKTLKIYIFTALVSIISNYIFIPIYSYYAAALITVISQAMIFLGTSVILILWLKNKISLTPSSSSAC